MDDKKRRNLKVARMPTDLPNSKPDKMLSMDTIMEISLLPTFEERIYEAAKYYIKLGWLVVPIRPMGKKLPKAEHNINYSHASVNPKEIDKWFHPATGKHKGYNIGIACGRKTDKGVNPVFVMDVDRHGEKDGRATLKALQDEHTYLPKGPVAETPNDGEHYFFQWEEGCVQSSDKIGKGIDSRGGEANACKGHVVAFPSQTVDGTYKWKRGGNPPPVAPWILKQINTVWKPKSSLVPLGSEEVTDADLERPISEPQIARMLAAIDPDELSYDDWLKLGMSVKSQLNDERGLALWHEWSEGGVRHKENECDIRWNGFSDFGTVRGGTLFYYAKKAGWMPDRDLGDRSGNPFDELVTDMNQTYALVTVGTELRILRETGIVVDGISKHYDLVKKATFEGLLQNDVIWVGEDDKAKPVPVVKIWLGHEARRTYDNGLGLFPPPAPTPKGYYNTWNGFAVDPLEGDCSLFKAHLLNVICNGNQEHYDWVWTWLADLMQDPANPKGCALVMKGGEGAGKGTLANTIGELLGPHHVHLIDDSHLTSNFNSHLFDAITIFADEITWGGNKKTAGKLKGMVTEKYLVGERKGIDAVQYHNRCHLMVASNNEWVIPASFDSRRWMVLDVSSDRVGDFDYFSAIVAELKNGGREALLYELLNFDIKDIALIRNVIVTDALRKQRSLTAATHVHKFLAQELTDGEANFITSRNVWVWDAKSLEARYKTWCDHHRSTMGKEPQHVDYGVIKEVLAIMNKDRQDSLFESVRMQVNKRRESVLLLPPLVDARDRLEEMLPGAFDQSRTRDLDVPPMDCGATHELPLDEWKNGGGH